MNKQGKLVNGKVVGGIEWVKTVLGPSVEIQGYTSNPIGGCPHKCRWEMPDGTIAECYAENVAENVAMSAYPNGFSAHYWNPKEMQKWHPIKEPKRIFMGSMTDWMSLNVSDDEIRQVIGQMQEAGQHTFMTLTKNAPRLLKFKNEIRATQNLWVGVSAPPSFMFGQRLSLIQQVKMIDRQMKVLSELETAIAWMSAEPLSCNIRPFLYHNARLDWVVIGAASNGRKTYQPKPEWVTELHTWADERGVPVFHKGNLAENGWTRREDFPK